MCHHLELCKTNKVLQERYLPSQEHEHVCVLPYITDKLVNMCSDLLSHYDIICYISLVDWLLSIFLHVTVKSLPREKDIMAQLSVLPASMLVPLLAEFPSICPHEKCRTVEPSICGTFSTNSRVVPSHQNMHE